MHILAHTGPFTMCALCADTMVIYLFSCHVDYFFWVLEIDGERKDNPDRPTIVPILETRGPKKFVKYPLGVAALVNHLDLRVDSVPIESTDTLGWIMNSQIHFNRVLRDLKKRNYAVTTTEEQILELGRLKLLRRLGLQELKKH